MPKSNAQGGKKHKRGKKNKLPEDTGTANMPKAGSNQVYGLVKSKLGGKRVLLECTDSKTRHGIIPGSMYKRVWLNIGDVVMCTIATIGKTDSCTVNYKYNNKEATALKSEGLIDFNFTTVDEAADAFEFTDNNDIAPQKYVPTMDLPPSDDEEEDEEQPEPQLEEQSEEQSEPQPEEQSEEQSEETDDIEPPEPTKDLKVLGKKKLNKFKKRTGKFLRFT
jgi:initiation factor 1A